MPVFRSRTYQNTVTFIRNIPLLPFRSAGHLTQGADWDKEARAPRSGKERRNQAMFRHPEKYPRKTGAPQVLAGWMAALKLFQDTWWKGSKGEIQRRWHLASDHIIQYHTF